MVVKRSVRSLEAKLISAFNISACMESTPDALPFYILLMALLTSSSVSGFVPISRILSVAVGFDGSSGWGRLSTSWKFCTQRAACSVVMLLLSLSLEQNSLCCFHRGVSGSFTQHSNLRELLPSLLSFTIKLVNKVSFSLLALLFTLFILVLYNLSGLAPLVWVTWCSTAFLSGSFFHQFSAMFLVLTILYFIFFL